MSNPLSLSLAFLAGIVLGTVFFGALWWTVHSSVGSKHPALWFLVSLLLRVSTVLTGFYFVGRDQWQRLVICLAGFVIARLIMLRLNRSVASKSSTAREATHAP